MSYNGPYKYANDVEKLKGTSPILDKNQEAQCVALVKHWAKSPEPIPQTTGKWTPGLRVMDMNPPPPPGTAIATFKDGKPPYQNVPGQSHAALFLRLAVEKGVKGFEVVEQFKGLKKVRIKFYPALGEKNTSVPLEKNADTYYVIMRSAEEPAKKPEKKTK